MASSMPRAARRASAIGADVDVVQIGVEGDDLAALIRSEEITRVRVLFRVGDCIPLIIDLRDRPVVLSAQAARLLRPQ